MNMKSCCIAATVAATALVNSPLAHADDIGTTAIKAGNFTTLVKAVKAAGLAPVIMGNSKLTVFAPTDAAFAKLPAGTVEMLLKPENKATLKKILTYHVLPGTVTAKKVVALPSGTKVSTVEGEKFIVRQANGMVMVDPGMGAKATVTKTDIMADNGVIHVIDTVLLPPSIQRAMAKK
ncbi:fasciclin domain-containing protein [bacterium]|nr:MAG: fasciclin domain-containing protein [bacterium]